MKILFQIVVPPALLVASFLVMKGSSKAAVTSVVQNLPLPPSMYLFQGSVSSKDHTQLLLQNSTGKSISDVIASLNDGTLKHSLVGSLPGAKNPHDVGFKIEKYNMANGKVFQFVYFQFVFFLICFLSVCSISY